MQKIANKKPNVTVNPDEVVALGAAVQAGVLAGARTCRGHLQPISFSGYLKSMLIETHQGLQEAHGGVHGEQRVTFELHLQLLPHHVRSVVMCLFMKLKSEYVHRGS